MKWFLAMILSVVLLLAVAGGWTHRAEFKPLWSGVSEPLLVIGRQPPRPDPERYAVLKEEVSRWQHALGERYEAAASEDEREAVIDDARVFLEAVLPELMNCWLGTRWDFNGTAEIPGGGQVACGYFVATVLRDAGFALDRYKLARQPSQNILRTFLSKKDMKLRVGVPYESYASELRGLEPGIRIVGLDTHVGFIVGRGDEFRFIHSSGSSPWCVVDEDQENAAVLKRSNYRVQGSLTGNREVLRRWLQGERWKVAGT